MTGGTSAPGRHERLLEQRLLLAGAIGIVLWLVNHLSGRSLSLDEAMLSLNIMTRTPAGLLQPF